ncbi:hypothetical protein NliqN6_5007 [Naganishia liquefaciens]|uniref:Major facilitator superfamily (MFS) profile domain-containing protein n=1 Tax=Naganishia liquefaciens TaxID=104408 RepID=A0A8H3TXF2_9TREE|nr:hypothetical protein NliqN6_5007 [Naganishia liquefaciens]
MDAKVPQPTFGHDDYKLEVTHAEHLNDKESFAEQGGQHGEPVLDIVYEPGTAEEKALVRKMDRRLLPILWLMYVFNYLDRTNIGNAKVGGMEKELGLSSSDYSLALSIFFVGYLLNEVPSNMLLARSRPSIFLPALMFAWGAMSVGAKGINNLGGLVAFRFCLGLVEAGFFPGVMLLLSCWYKPNELSKRLALFYSASLTSGAFGGLLAGVITEYMHDVGNTPGWKWLFIIEGLATVVISIVAFFILPDYPTTTKWLSEREKALAVARLVSNEDKSERLGHRQAFVAAVKDLKTWIFTLIYVLINGAGTISYFFPTLMTVLGYTGRDAQFMTVPIYVVAMVISLSMGWNADRTNQKAYHIIAATIWSAVSFVICATVKKAAVRQVVEYAFIAFGGAGIWTAVPIFLSYMVTNFEGREKRAVSIALINGFGNLASVYGSYIWPKQDAPQYKAGFAATTGLIAAGGLVTAFARYKYGNPPRIEELMARQQEEAKRVRMERETGE